MVKGLKKASFNIKNIYFFGEKFKANVLIFVPPFTKYFNDDLNITYYLQ